MSLTDEQRALLESECAADPASVKHAAIAAALRTIAALEAENAALRAQFDEYVRDDADTRLDALQGGEAVSGRRNPHDPR